MEDILTEGKKVGPMCPKENTGTPRPNSSPPIPKPKKVTAWKYECRDCGHITYIPVGYGLDIICHKCWNYNLEYLGKVEATQSQISKGE